MDEGLALIAADVFAQLSRDPGAAGSHPQPQGDPRQPEAEVEDDARPAASRHPAPWHTGSWAREHLTEAALMATVMVSGLARFTRRGRRRRGPR
jgi:hypothetical protein